MLRTVEGLGCLQCGHRIEPPLRATPVPERLKGHQGPGPPSQAVKLCRDCGKVLATRHYHAKLCLDCSSKR